MTTPAPLNPTTSAPRGWREGDWCAAGADASLPLLASYVDPKSGRESFAAEDALRLRAVGAAVHLAVAPQLSPACYHMNRGVKALVADVCQSVSHTAIKTPTTNAMFIYKTDVRNYYYSVNHARMLATCTEVGVPDHWLPQIATYLTRFRWHVRGGQHADSGLPKGGALSPLLGEVYLTPMDHALHGMAQRLGGFYGRFMDDIIIMAPSRFVMRRMRTMLYRYLNQAEMRTRPEKSLALRLMPDRFFDFCGYRLSSEGVIGLAATTIQKTAQKVTWCSAQGLPALRAYGQRFESWARGGLKKVLTPKFDDVMTQLKADLFGPICAEATANDPTPGATAPKVCERGPTPGQAGQQRTPTNTRAAAVPKCRAVSSGGSRGGVNTRPTDPLDVVRTRVKQHTHARHVQNLWNLADVGSTCGPRKRYPTRPTPIHFCHNLILIWEHLLCYTEKHQA